MTADEFVAALAEASCADQRKRPETRPWAKIRRRRKPAFEHPDDPALDLLARYDVTKLEFWQLRFTTKTAAEIDGIWHVATKSTDDFYVENGSVLKMYYKEAYPGGTGLSSGSFSN